MASTIRLEIVTPDRSVYDQQVNMVIARATDGDIGILPGHAPLIAGLAIAPLRVKLEEGEEQFAVSGGFIEVQPDKITILAATAESAAEIDVKRATEAKERAENRLKSAAVEIDFARAEAALQRALVRLKVVEFLKSR
ncbi:MAG TPA: F0F1 ATP synthase subunit epsilon [Firmicutes bacterium]|nr:F0F1 ATP synthase subunit epsilon [Bacillota bacterium]